jgi:HAD superfamily hydrolase (TIGR01509 family)
MPRLALFDLDGTLIGPPEAAFRRAIAEFVEFHRLDGAAFEWLTGDALARWSESMSTYFERVAERFGLADPDRLLAWYRARYLASLAPIEGVVDGLARLRQAGWRTGIVTNGPTDVQLVKLAHVGLDRLVDAVCASEAEGSWKPDEKIFRRAAEKAGASPEGAWMVGDSLEADIAGGNALGMTTAWVSGGRPCPPGSPVPTHVVATTAEVFDLVLSAR